MDKPGRNDPCYCGSGKKYKQCHMAADMAAENEQRTWADAARELRQDLLDFADDPRFEDERGAVAAHYWNELYTADTLPLMSILEAERFLDWFAFDHLPESGERVVEIYRREQGDSLPPAQRALLDRWVGSPPMSGYELTGYERQTLRVKELVSGAELEVFEPDGHGNAPLGSLLLARPVPVHDHTEFFALSAYIPPEEVGDLPAKLAAARKADGAGGDAGFLRRQNVLLIHHALQQAQAAGRPPVARLDPHHQPETVQQRARHGRVRVKGPNTLTDTVPHVAQTRRKAI